MKNSKFCPKCQSTDIVRFDGYVGPYGSGNNLVVGAFSSVNVNRYICCRCGYTEEWIDREQLDRISESRKAKKNI